MSRCTVYMRYGNDYRQKVDLETNIKEVAYNRKAKTG